MKDQVSRAQLTHSPSFRDGTTTAGSISTVDRSSDYESYDDGFEFSVNGAAVAALTEPADEIFSNGRILPVYPVFNSSLLNSDSDLDPSEQMRSLAISDLADLRSGSTSSTSSADSVDIDGGSYCKWTPQSPAARCRKSASTGSGSGSATSRRWRMRDLLGGRRSHSDGKEKFVFLNNPDPNPKSKSELGSNPNPKPKGEKTKTKKKEKKVVKEMDLVTAHKLFYGKEKREERRSFLPYRQELVGIFANNRGNQFHPF